MNHNSRPRLLLKRLHKVMAGADEGQGRLDRVVHEIASNMVADVCSLYLLELFAAEGLHQKAVHNTRLKIGEGVIGLIAREKVPFNLAEASKHPKFRYFPETGEERFQSLMGVPIIRRGASVGVLAIQTKDTRHYAEEEVEALQTVAMVMAELLGQGELIDQSQIGKSVVEFQENVTIQAHIFAEGLATGEAVFHEPKVEVVRISADNIEDELERLDDALMVMRTQLEKLVVATDLEHELETREILETYKMFAYDRGWQEKIRGAIEAGLTAEAAVERVQRDLQTRMSRAHDPYLRERLGDLENLSARLVRVLMGYYGEAEHHKLVTPSIIVAKTMGPAELLEYDRTHLSGIVLEDGSPTSHIAIVAKALKVPLLGQAHGLLAETQEHDTLVVDAVSGRVIIRPAGDIASTYEASLRERTALARKYAAQVNLPSVSRDNVEIELMLNAGLLIDLDNLATTGASGIGLFRTEFQFMVSSTMPRMQAQTELYSRALDAVEGRRLVFRTLDIGGDKRVSFLPLVEEENPAMGWRGVRMGLDRPGLLRYQLRALVASAAGRDLNIMFPMVANADEFLAAREILRAELAYVERMGREPPKRIAVGCMVEIPSLVWDLDRLLQHADFVSIGTNDLIQFFFASERGNAKISERYDALSSQFLRFLSLIVNKCEAHNVPVTMCGETGGKSLEALAFIALGINSFSLSAPSISPVKMMVRSLDVAPARAAMKDWLGSGTANLRAQVKTFAEEHKVFLS